MTLLNIFRYAGMAMAAVFAVAASALALAGIVPGALIAVGMTLAWLIFGLLADNCRLRLLLRQAGRDPAP